MMEMSYGTFQNVCVQGVGGTIAHYIFKHDCMRNARGNLNTPASYPFNTENFRIILSNISAS